jgi:uncharacterized membrane protein/ubiquinone/menaquinone biosynthesis C-methylase UbiE
MSPLWLMIALFLLLGAPGVRRLAGGTRPADRAAVAMAIVMLIPAVLHFTHTDQFLAIIPSRWPFPETLVLASGAAEFLLAVLLVFPATRRAGGWFGVALFLAIWPANIAVAVSGNVPEGFPQSALYHWIRVPFQLLYVGWAGWAALGHLPGRGFRQRMFSRFYDRIQARYEKWGQERRRALLSEVRGTVLELGPGTGINFRFLPKEIHWIGVKPNPHMHRTLRLRAAEEGFTEVEFREVTAEGMDLPAESVDAVVITLVLCSVEDPTKVVGDVLRVLRPGGKLYFTEHVAAPRGSGTRRLQRVIRPLWEFIGDGCIVDRETASVIQEAGFAEVELEEFEVPRNIAPRWVGPHILGVATKGIR